MAAESKQKQTKSVLDFSSDYDKQKKAKIRPYDFRKPKKITKENASTLKSVYDSFTRLFSSAISGILRVMVETSEIRIEEHKYSEFIESLPSNTNLGLVTIYSEDISRDDNTFIVHLPSLISFTMIDILLGGTGSNNNINRAHTEIEAAIVQNIMKKVTSILEEAWKTLLDLKFNLEKIESNPAFAQIMSASESIALVTFDMTIGDVTDCISMCFPASYIEEILNLAGIKMKAKLLSHQDVQKEKEKRQLIYDTLSDTDLELKAVLGEIQLQLSDVMALQVSDVIPLDKNINEDIQIMIDEVPWFSAKLGQVKIKKAFKLCDIISS